MKITYEITKDEICDAIEDWLEKNQKINFEQIVSVELISVDKALIVLDTKQRYPEGKD